MRTTLNLPDALAQEAKARAASEGRTLTSLIEEGLRRVLDDVTAEPPFEPLPTYGREGAAVLVDIDDRDALWGVLDADGPR